MPPKRLVRWVENFTSRHDGCDLAAAGGALHGQGGDGSTFAAELPFGRKFDGQLDGQLVRQLDAPLGRPTSCPEALADFLEQCREPHDWGVLLVRKGGFAVARLTNDAIVESKVGQRHVQGRSKAGGQSQQRFARRRDNQARQAYEAAAGHAARIVAPFEERLRSSAGAPGVVLVTGGDHDAVAAVLADSRLRRIADQVVEPFLTVPDPRRSVLESAVADAGSVRMTVVNT